MPAGRNWRRLGTGTGYDVLSIKRAGAEPPYSGHAAFILPLSEIETMPRGWRTILEETKGIYLVTCPRDRVHYVGMADTSFFSRWSNHAAVQGDAIGFRTREPADYIVSILEVAGSFTTTTELPVMESRWKEKLQSRSIGLNHN